VWMVLNHGADVNTRDKRHRTALHHAIKTHSLVVIEALIRHGADVNVSDFQGITPLTLAVKEKDRTAGRLIC
jgi:ankyrin repeat protein